MRIATRRRRRRRGDEPQQEGFEMDIFSGSLRTCNRVHKHLTAERDSLLLSIFFQRDIGKGKVELDCNRSSNKTALL